MIRLKLFGYNVWISREPLKVNTRSKKRNAYRNSQRNLRLEMTDNQCEICGTPIDKRCHIHRTLPSGDSGRNSVENIRVVCGECWRELEKNPHRSGYLYLEDVNCHE